jgi:hypothetical protein
MNDLAVAVGIILFPGLIACVICDKITVHTVKWESFKYGVYSFVLGVLCYVLLQAISLAWWQVAKLFVPPLALPDRILKVWSFAVAQKGAVEIKEVLAATALSPIVAAVAATIVNYKLLNRVASRLRISQKYGDENLYSYFLNSPDIDWVYVRDKTQGLTYQGRVVSFSENDHMQELVLSEVTVFGYDSSDEYYSVPHLFLAKPVGAFVIEAAPAKSLEDVNVEETAERRNNPQHSEDRSQGRSDETTDAKCQAATAATTKEEVGEKCAGV